MEFDAPEEIGGGGNFLNAPGTYHLHIDQVLEGQSASGKIIDGFTASVSCLDGTVRENNKCTEIGKTCNITFFSGKLTDKDKGQFARVRQAAFLVAANVIQPSQLGQRITIDLQKACGNQIVVTLEHDEQDTEKKYLRIAGASCYHVDDPRISGVPKAADALKLISAACRHDKAWFENVIKRKPKAEGEHKSGNGTPVGAGSGAASEAVNFDNL